MKILITGHDGYIGTVMTTMVQDAGHEVVGLDLGLFEDCAYYEAPKVPTLDKRDVRDVTAEDLEGFDAVVHLAAISNDPIGNLNADVTYAINHRASVALAEAAKAAGVERFIFASSCSSYGAADGDTALGEDADFNPVTPYGESKVWAERDIRPLADDSFTPVYMRNATAYGMSPRLRGDLVVHDLLAHAYDIGEVRMNSNGMSWRPFCHIEDITGAVLAALTAPRERVHNEAFNIGRDEDNLMIRDLALMIKDVVPGSEVGFAEGAGVDKRSYRVSFAKVREQLPEFQPQWTLERGIEDIYATYQRRGMDVEDFMSSRFMRIKRVLELKEQGVIDESLRRVSTPTRG